MKAIGFVRLVEPAGFEPATFPVFTGTRFAITLNLPGVCLVELAGFEPATSPVFTGTRFAITLNLPGVCLVEPAGFEPATSSMPSRRAPNCATAPRLHLTF